MKLILKLRFCSLPLQISDLLEVTVSVVRIWGALKLYQIVLGHHVSMIAAHGCAVSAARALRYRLLLDLPVDSLRVHGRGVLVGA